MAAKHYDVLIIGAGLAGLAAALRLSAESRHLKIGMLSRGAGATAELSGINGVFSEDAGGDSVEQYIRDMLRIGEHINDPSLVEALCRHSGRCLCMLEKWGVKLARRDGHRLRRHASGSTHPRTFYLAEGLLGALACERLHHLAGAAGLDIHRRTECRELLVVDGEIRGASVHSPAYGTFSITADIVVAAWGGIGRLFPAATYPADVDGRGLAMAFDAGIPLIDLEFVEFEPTVIIWPAEARGELFLTALFGDGAVLLNGKQERFLIRSHASGEAGCPKHVMNRAILGEIAEGRGSEHGGVYADIRHLPAETVQAYPWFHRRIAAASFERCKDMLEVAPMAHGHLGGVSVGPNGLSRRPGFYAVGEAAGGAHGACRLAGNAATQALVSGILAAEDISGRMLGAHLKAASQEHPPAEDLGIFRSTVPRIRAIVGRCLGPMREASALQAGIGELDGMLRSPEIQRDSRSRQTVLSAYLIARTCLLRAESRGHHSRTDYPQTDAGWLVSLEVAGGSENEARFHRVDRSGSRDESMTL